MLGTPRGLSVTPQTRHVVHLGDRLASRRELGGISRALLRDIYFDALWYAAQIQWGYCHLSFFLVPAWSSLSSLVFQSLRDYRDLFVIVKINFNLGN